MATTTRTVTKLLRSTLVTQGPRRSVHSRAPFTRGRSVQPLLLTAVGAAGLYGVYKSRYFHNLPDLLPTLCRRGVVHAAATVFPASQASVFSQTKDHALYLWIHLSPQADAKKCARVAANIQRYVHDVSPADMRDESDEIWAGSGFGPAFLAKIGGKSRKNYTYPDRKGIHGGLPSTGGDIFIHAKSNNTSKLFELAQRVLAEMPAGSVEKFEDIYSFVYRNGRDLSGFIDGTENAADDEHRQRVAVEKETGGSYVITQKWVHRMDVINKESDSTLSGWVGREREDSTELKKKAITSHVARITGGDTFEQKKMFEIVRQSMPYGNLHDKAGLFFIGYSASPENLEYMLKRMVGDGAPKEADDIMRLSECVTGTYWYFPGLEELKKWA